MALGDLYFDVLFRDKTREGERAIRERLSKVGVDIGTSWAQGLKSQLQNLTANIKPQFSNIDVSSLMRGVSAPIQLTVDSQKLVSDIRQVLSSHRFNLSIGGGNGLNISANDAKAQAQLINAQARLVNAQARQAQVANMASLAQARLATEQARTARETNRAAIEDTRLQRQRLALQQATERATRATRAYNNSFGGSQIGVLSQLTTLANRYVSAFAGGAFLTSLIRIRGEFELQLVALKSIIQSSSYASQIYQQMQSLSVQSPFQFKDLISYAKQLAAYQIPASELYDTTKRLADVSAGLGVDMGRIILAYGQVRSATVLRGTELRQFTEAGIPMVQLLADKFSELESQVVSTADVFDRISKREVPFAMVKEIFDDMTSSGGMFYQMQEKQAETLYGKWSNLADAYQIMMNKIGESSDGVLKYGIEGLTELMSNYESIITTLTRVAGVYGLVKVASMVRLSVLGQETAQTLALALAEKKKQASDLMREAMVRKLTQQEQALINTRSRLTIEDYKQLVANNKLNQSDLQRLYLLNKITKAEFTQLATQMGMSSHLMRHATSLSKYSKAWTLLSYGINKVGVAFRAFTQMLKSNLLIAVLMTAFEIVMDIVRVLGEGQSGELTKNIAQAASESIQELDRFTKSYQSTLDRISAKSLSTDELAKATQRIKEEIANVLGDEIGEVTYQIDIEADPQKAAEKAKSVLETIRAAISQVGNAKYYITEDSVLWGLFGEGLLSDISDYSNDFREWGEVVSEVEKSIGSLNTVIADMPLEGQIAAVQMFTTQLLAMADVTPQVKEAIANLIWGKSSVGYNPASIDKALDAYVKNSGIKSAIESGAVLSEEFIKSFNMKLANEGVDVSAIKGLTASEITQKLRIRIFPEVANPTAIDELIASIPTQTQTSTLSIPEYRAKSLREIGDELDATNWQGKKVPNTTTGGNVGVSYQLISDEAIKRNKFLRTILADETTTVGMVAKLQEKRAEYDKFIKAGASILATESTKKDAEEAKRNKQIVEEALDALQAPYVSSTTTNVDEETNRLKARFDLISNALTEYDKLASSIGGDKAFTQIKEMPGLKGILSEDEFSAYFKTDGKKELISDYLKKISSKTTTEANNFRESLEKALRGINIDDIADKVKEEIEKINEAIKIGTDNYKLYQQILNKTGNKKLAAFSAYGNENALAKDQLTLLKEALTAEGFSVEEIAQKTEAQFNDLPQKVRDIYNHIKTVSNQNAIDLAKSISDAIAKGLSVEDKISVVQQKYDKLIADATEQNYSQDTINALISARDREINELKSKLIELLPVWKQIFGKTANKSYSQLKGAIDVAKQLVGNATGKIGDNGDKIFSSSFIDADGITQQVTLTEDQLEKLIEIIETLQDKLRDKNPFLAFAEALNNLTNGDATSEELTELFLAFGDIAAIAGQATRAIASMFEAMGDEAAADSLNTASTIASGIASIAQGFAQGGWIGAAVAAVGVLADVVQGLFEAHDKAMERSIQASKARVKELQNLRDEIDRLIERSLGGAMRVDISAQVEEDRAKWSDFADWIKAAETDPVRRFWLYFLTEENELKAVEERLKGISEYDAEMAKGNKIGATYKYQLASYKAEIYELRQQIQNEKDKKETDRGKIEDMEAQISELEDAVRYFAEDTLKELMDIDLKSWASDLSDSLVEAFAAGEDAAEAFDKTVGDMMKSVVKQMASLYILEPMMEELRTYLFGEDGASGAFGSDYELDKSEVIGLGDILDKIGEKGVPAVEALFNAIDQGLGGALTATYDDNTSSLSGGIKSITEDTADLLASYINAIRAHIATLMTQNAITYELAQAQLSQLVMIAANTGRGAIAIEDLKDLFESVTTVGSNGRTLKI